MGRGAGEGSRGHGRVARKSTEPQEWVLRAAAPLFQRSKEEMSRLSVSSRLDPGMAAAGMAAPGRVLWGKLLWKMEEELKILNNEHLPLENYGQLLPTHHTSHPCGTVCD